jgi:osmotically-inducible protein OsmY
MTTATKKAKKEGRKAVKRAQTKGQKAANRAGTEAQAVAAEYAERAGAAASEAAGELAERLRTSEGLAKAQTVGSEYAGKAKQRWEDADVEDKLLEVAQRLRSSDFGKKAEQKSKDVTETGFGALSDWLTSSKQGKQVSSKLGLQPRRRWRTVLIALIAAAAGFAIARLVQPKPLPDFGDDFTASAEQLSTQPPAGTDLVDAIRTALKGDPRTAELDEITINVAEGTVFIRGSVPEGTDEDAIRELVGRVPGVTDVDLQLATATPQQ